MENIKLKFKILGIVVRLSAANNSNSVYNVNPNNRNVNNNNNAFGVRVVASINCGYAIINCIRDNIETNYCPLARISYK